MTNYTHIEPSQIPKLISKCADKALSCEIELYLAAANSPEYFEVGDVTMKACDFDEVADTYDMTREELRAFLEGKSDLISLRVEELLDILIKGTIQDNQEYNQEAV